MDITRDPEEGWVSLSCYRVMIHDRTSGRVLHLTGQAGMHPAREVVRPLEEAMWAICTRCDPEKDIDILRRCWSGPLDPIIPPGQKDLSSLAIIDDTQPYEWRDQFPQVAASSPERRDEVLKKWGHLLS